MKIGPFSFGRAAEPLQAAAEPVKSPPAELGSSGTVNLNGYLSVAEYNPDLVGKRALQVYDRMTRSDGTVQEALEHLFSPIKNATWSVEPASDDPEHLEHAEFVRRCYFDWAAQPFLEYLDHALDYLAFGHQVFEIVYQVTEGQLTLELPDTDGPTVLPPRQFVTWKAFAPRLPLTIWKWNTEAGELVSIVQQTFKNGGYVEAEIPAEQLLVFTNKRRGDEFTGRSILRAAYKAWTFKELVEKVSAIAVERHGVGVPIGYPPEDAKHDATVMERLENILKTVRSGAFSFIAAPGPKATASTPGWTFEIMSPTGGIPDFSNLLSYQRAEIKASVLARFAELGHASVGARATGDIQSIVWYAALHAAARYIGDVNQTAIRRLVDMNYVTDEYPRLVANDIEVRNLAEFAEAHARLVMSGAIIPDKAYRDAVRAATDMPDEEEATEQMRQAEQDSRLATPPAAGAPPSPPAPGAPPAVEEE